MRSSEWRTRVRPVSFEGVWQSMLALTIRSGCAESFCARRAARPR
ncbi:hypothetical protein BURMUCF2_A2078 [Burkholderia multivorans CF2]|nr:hypothetical protein BURMUCF2_A2078 [Burkholderia multivorans CF2]